MKLIIGLGNPGEKYKNNRHNVGYMLIDKLKTLNSKQILIFKSTNFMNNSGKFVKELVVQYRSDLANLWIIHDDLDIPIGGYKIQFGKGPKDHNGLNDIYSKLGSQDFWHVRMGVDNRDLNDRIEGKDYVLQDFTKEEKEILDRVIDKVCKKLATL